jgi:hypothetical protein
MFILVFKKLFYSIELSFIPLIFTILFFPKKQNNKQKRIIVTLGIFFLQSLINLMKQGLNYLVFILFSFIMITPQ